MKCIITFAVFLVILLVITVSIVYAGSIDGKMWEQTYGGSSDDYANSILQTSDGGAAIAGYTKSFGMGNSDFWLVKVDEDGNLMWNQTYGGAGPDVAYSVIQTPNGGYAVAGDTESFGNGFSDIWLVKVDSSGNIQWNRTYGGTENDGAGSLIQTSDGGYAIAGATSSFGVVLTDTLLVKVDSSGNVQWNQTYGGTGHDNPYSLIQNSDGDYVIAGFTSSFGAGNGDFWLVKIDQFGIMEWNRTFGGIGEDGAASLLEASDGGYVVAGYTYSFGEGMSDFWLIKTDSTGNLEWNYTYGGTGDEIAAALVQTADEGYALAGYTNSLGDGDFDSWLVKTDSSGNLQWNYTYGGEGRDVTHSMVRTSDWGYFLAGASESFGAGMSDVWVAKTDGHGIIPEFPLGVLIVLFSIFTLVAVVIKKNISQNR